MESAVSQFLSRHGQSDKLIVVFYATWFRPALAVKAEWETRSEEEEEEQIVFVDVDEEIELVEALKLPRVPAVYLFKDDEIVQKNF